MIKEDEWYKNRILWKSHKVRLFEFNCLEFDKLHIDNIMSIKRRIPEDFLPVIICFEDKQTWTLLCTRFVVSLYDNKLHIFNKEEFTYGITPYVNKESNEICINSTKKYAKWLYIEKTKQFIWFPSSKELWAFWSVLLTLSRLESRE